MILGFATVKEINVLSVIFNYEKLIFSKLNSVGDVCI